MSTTPLDQHREANASDAAVSEITRTIETSGVEFIYYQGISVTGRVMGKVVPAKHLRRNLEKGINLHRTAISDLQTDRAGNLIGGGVQAPEFTAMADLDTFAVLPWDNSVARFFTQIYEPEHLPEIGGQRLGTDSRGTLKRVHADFTAKTGLELRSGCEPEMTWKGPGLAVRFAAGASPSYHIDNLELMRPVYQRVIRYATALGLNMIEGDYEDPGQLELNWMFDKADLTADRLITYRQICRQVARELDLVASFMPKPATGMMGNGCHHNISFWRGDQNVLAEPGRRELHLTQEGQHLLGGILSHTPGSMLINGQTVNSYKRYWDAGQFAPSEINWGMDNRSCTVRLSANGRLECRLPDASVNPYLSHAAIIGAAADGLANAIDPGPSHVGDSEVGAAGRFEPLPLTLAEAISAFQRDNVIQNTLGEQMSQMLIDYKTDEWARFCSAVTDYEQTRYEQAIP